MSVQAESKHNTVLEAALLAEAPKQWEHFQRNRLKRVKGLPKWKRELEEIDGRIVDARAKAEKLRRQYDPELMRVNAILERKISSAIGLRCSKCGEPDRGNKMNEKPWCFTCNIPLELPNSAKERFPDSRVLPKTKRLDVTFKRLDEC